jgi:transcriptional regulator with XRE-family HTH domain
MTTTAAPAPASTGFGEKLRRLRKARGWSQDELGAKVAIHGRHVGKYEAGRVLPNAETLLRIARLLQVSIDYLLRDEVSDAGDPQAALHDPMLLKQFSALENMDDRDRDVIRSLIDAYIKKSQIEGVMKE